MLTILEFVFKTISFLYIFKYLVLFQYPDILIMSSNAD